MVVTGHDLEGDTVRLRIRHPALNDPLDTPPVAVATAGRLEAPLPAGLPAGLATVAAVVSRIGHDDFVTGEVGIAIRPTVKNAPFAVNRAGDGHITVTADVAPDVLAGQKAFLVAFGKAHPAEPFATPTTGSLTFTFAAEPGTTPIRLRVGGADSRLILDGPPPTYDPDMRLEVT